MASAAAENKSPRRPSKAAPEPRVTSTPTSTPPYVRQVDAVTSYSKQGRRQPKLEAEMGSLFRSQGHNPSRAAAKLSISDLGAPTESIRKAPGPANLRKLDNHMGSTASYKPRDSLGRSIPVGKLPVTMSKGLSTAQYLKRTQRLGPNKGRNQWQATVVADGKPASLRAFDGALHIETETKEPIDIPWDSLLLHRKEIESNTIATKRLANVVLRGPPCRVLQLNMSPDQAHSLENKLQTYGVLNDAVSENTNLGVGLLLRELASHRDRDGVNFVGLATIRVVEKGSSMNIWGARVGLWSEEAKTLHIVKWKGGNLALPYDIMHIEEVPCDYDPFSRRFRARLSQLGTSQPHSRPTSVSKEWQGWPSSALYIDFRIPIVIAPSSREIFESKFGDEPAAAFARAVAIEQRPSLDSAPMPQCSVLERIASEEVGNTEAGDQSPSLSHDISDRALKPEKAASHVTRPIGPSEFYSKAESTPRRRLSSLTADSLPSPKLASDRPNIVVRGPGKEKAVRMAQERVANRTGRETSMSNETIESNGQSEAGSPDQRVSLNAAQAEDHEDPGSEDNPIVLATTPTKQPLKHKALKRVQNPPTYHELDSDDGMNGEPPKGLQEAPLELDEADYSALIEKGFRAFTHTFEDGRRSELGVHDIARLNPRVYLDDQILLFFLKLSRDSWLRDHPSESPAFLQVLNTFFYTLVNRNDIPNWILRLPLVESHVLILPIHENVHWTVAVIIGLDWLACEGPEHKRPIVAVLDSLTDTSTSSTARSNFRKASKVLRQVLTLQQESGVLGRNIAAPRPRDFREVRLTVPLQPNLYDCGVYVVHFVQQILSHLAFFVERLEEAAETNAGPLNLGEFWRPHELGKKRDALRHALAELGGHTSYVTASKPSATQDTPQDEDRDGEEDDSIEVVEVIEQPRKRNRTPRQRALPRPETMRPHLRPRPGRSDTSDLDADKTKTTEKDEIYSQLNSGDLVVAENEPTDGSTPAHKMIAEDVEAPSIEYS